MRSGSAVSSESDVSGEEDPAAAVTAVLAERDRWLSSPDREVLTGEGDPLAYGPVIRFYERSSSTVDFRTGLMTPQGLTVGQLRAFVLAQLPLPPEVPCPE